MDSENAAILIEAIVDSTLFVNQHMYLDLYLLHAHYYCRRKRSAVGRPQKIFLSLIIFAFVLNCWDYCLNSYAAILLGAKYSFIFSSTGDLNDNLGAVIGGLNSTILMSSWPLNLNLLIGDAIVVWRSWIIGGGHKVFKYIMALFMAANIGTNLADGILDDTITHAMVQYHWTIFRHLCLSRRHQKDMNSITPRTSRTKKSNIEIILLFLLQSGAAFCAIQLVYAVIQIPSFTTFLLAMATVCNGAAVLYPLSVFIMVNTIDTPLIEAFYDTKAAQESQTVSASIVNPSSE
ncbi:hypothetical protein BT96DRAFT_919242 [Gymnopus androsaceus JB14]|uniref:Uncharacterized protein n=1 Tax=Gymnopus androsaceus JB14 TaxID=1447944 RepID=A0A6A4HVX7_9AGAR|nr:hypothetical protein BT96DRAFT_919242 [Gymnopus androsaceus JB14]